MTIQTVEEVKDFILKRLDDKKATNINVISLEGKTDFAKYMIFANGTSTKNVSSIASSIAQDLKENTRYRISIEGIGSEWVLIDTADIIVHIFYPEARNKYKLEDLWNK